jgi:hypothetical protein
MNPTPALYDAYASLKSSNVQQSEDGSSRSGNAIQSFNGRVGDITQMWLSDNERGECFLTGQPATSDESITKRFGSYSVLLRRNVYPENSERGVESQLEVQSRSLCEVLRNVAPHLRTVNMNAMPIIFKAPYHELYHFRQEISASGPDTISGATGDSLSREISELIKFLNESIGKAAIAEIEALKTSRRTSMEFLWSVFKPGEMVVLRTNGLAAEPELCCGVVQSFFTKNTPEGQHWGLKLRHMSVDGERLGAIEKEYLFVPFIGQMDIINLSAFPLAYIDDLDYVTKRLSERGRSYLQLCWNPDGTSLPVHKNYRGPIWIQRKAWEVDGCQFYDDAERMVSCFPSFKLRRK